MTYLVFKSHNLSIQETQLLEVSNITKKEFNRFKLKVPKVLPNYLNRYRKEYILQRILEVAETYGLGMEFFHRAKEILLKFWGILSNTKDDVVAGMGCAMALLCDHVQKISVNALCRGLGIQMSTVHSQVKYNIFEKFHISGFVSLIKSSDLLKTFLLKVLERKFSQSYFQSRKENPRRIRVRIIRTVPFFRRLGTVLRKDTTKRK